MSGDRDKSFRDDEKDEEEDGGKSEADGGGGNGTEDGAVSVTSDVDDEEDEEEDEDEAIEEKPGQGIFATTFLMIFLAEFGDKTQIAIAGLGSTANATATWAGATLALACTSILGVYAGRRLLHRLPLRWIQRISGAFFLLLALLAVLHLISTI